MRSSASSPGSTGGNRGSDRAAETATCRITWPSGRSPLTWPMQPRRAWVARASSVTNAPRRSFAPGTSGSSGRERPHRDASMARRASVSSAARSAEESSGSSMVLLAAPDGVRAIELFVDDDPGELVRQRQRSETPGALGTPANVIRHAVMIADHERNIPSLHLPPTHQLGELLRAPLLAALGQRDHARIFRDPRLSDFAFLDLGVVLDPAQVFVTGRPQRGALHARPAERDDAILHQA